MEAAFAKTGMVMLVELGIHNPLAAVIGKEGESELAMAKELPGFAARGLSAYRGPALWDRRVFWCC